MAFSDFSVEIAFITEFHDHENPALIFESSVRTYDVFMLYISEDLDFLFDVFIEGRSFEDFLFIYTFDGI